MDPKQTCVVSPMHASMVVAHGIEIIEEVLWLLLLLMLLLLQLLWGSLVLLVVRGCRSLLPLHHMRSHVQAGQGKAHLCGQLVAAVGHLPEALEVQNENVGKRP